MKTIDQYQVIYKNVIAATVTLTHTDDSDGEYVVYLHNRQDVNDRYMVMYIPDNGDDRRVIVNDDQASQFFDAMCEAVAEALRVTDGVNVWNDALKDLVRQYYWGEVPEEEAQLNIVHTFGVPGLPPIA